MEEEHENCQICNPYRDYYDDIEEELEGYWKFYMQPEPVKPYEWL